ncbi:MAG: HAD-IA family hydrolase [Ruminococcus sp.]|nr:HAD-IA family hydrolase [Candidatus Apopatosoma intestinale]
MGKYKVALFDLDGTLLDTLGDLTASTNYALRHFGLPERTAEEVRSYVGNGVENQIRCACPDSVDESVFAGVLAAYKTHYAAHADILTKPYDGVLGTLSALKREGFRIGVASNKFEEAAVPICRKYFGDLLDAVAGESALCPRKPNPAMLFRLLDELGCEAKDAVYVGDSDVDIKTGKAAGIRVISCSWGFRDRSFLVRSRKEWLFETDITDLADFPSDLLSLLCH